MKKSLLRVLFTIALAALLTSGVAEVKAEVGVTDTMITFGTFQDMSGPAAYLGGMVTGAINAWKKYVNEELGGIHGRKVEVIVEDNKYDPQLTKTVFSKLVNQHKVFALLTVYGSTPCVAILEDVKKEKIPVVTTAASVESMFDPVNRYMFWYAGNAQDEGILMVDYVVNDLKAKAPKIGVCYQDDEWGKDGRKGVELACKKYGLTPSFAPYKRGEKNLNSQAMRLKADGVTHCFYVGYAPVYAALLAEADKVGWKPIFFGDYVSVDPKAFMAEKLADGHFHIFNWGLRNEGGEGWKQMEKYFKETGAEKLLAAPLMPVVWNPLMLVTKALQDCGKDLTREKFIDAIEKIGEYDAGGLGKIGFGPDMRKGTKYYRVLKADAEKKDFKPITDWREPSLVWGKREK